LFKQHISTAEWNFIASQLKINRGQFRFDWQFPIAKTDMHKSIFRVLELLGQLRFQFRTICHFNFEFSNLMEIPSLNGDKSSW